MLRHKKSGRVTTERTPLGDLITLHASEVPIDLEILDEGFRQNVGTTTGGISRASIRACFELTVRAYPALFRVS